MKRGLLILVHGSKSKEADEITKELIRKLKHKLSDEFQEVAYGALQISSPSVEEGIDNLVENEMEEIIVVPMFIFQGVHVKSDIPDVMENIKNKYPQINIKLGKHIGADDRLVEILYSRAIDTIACRPKLS
ncbi:sirohydrochlorin chelatase [Alkaliphilus peptidifermentans]|uniref:Sirohydrochlorin cobaltochelatase n=1 Tax=Alkaliphilus peptidifermentans DSM 18978 TaxID=1120976 RepID=A0A1G5ARN2_9FIRM|nr:CbiX/SirB N-terminal domain-containing protein [Alkaliphilus peptidifermentans]SCX80547.1 sirohydrochlorin cobaltochelatase [Alkaliphilus peptidifermentans DSM 18978]